ncbi:hypothetical protein K7X08_033122 [Anisodus acutangulus]|uniref:Protein kinase domain-containing protein n=1 Tax=Anisodus acutangulus TaxID=402998 RepID=A0A9Q1M235_9SOLA|nr:hypothetical protein K7X08_033122 [Anisodus acutangulus]
MTLFSLTDDKLFINCGGKSVTVRDNRYYADLNRNGASTFYIDERGGWGYSSMGVAKPLPYIINETCNLPMPSAVLHETARFCPDLSQGKNVQKNYNIEEEAAEDVYGDKTLQYNVDIESQLVIHLYWSGNGTAFYGPLISAISVVRVKQLSAKSKQGIREFVNEIGTTSALQHPNLVKLMGCCAEDNELLLIYECMENNSLDHALFGSEELKSRLNWLTRVKIVLGIAKGLTYLHEESKLKIIHRDIKPTNILLDKELNAKITDFGYAKLNDGEHTHVITQIAGTTGYMAPEYAMWGYLTPKSDVYSFGVGTLEIVSGRNSASYRPSDQTVYLLDLAYVLHEQGNLIELVDPQLGTDYSWTEAAAILELAMMCTNPSPTLRPTMSEVVKVIEGKTKIKTTSSTVHRSTDEIALINAMAALSQSSQSESHSTAGPSQASPSYSNSIISNDI